MTLFNSQSPKTKKPAQRKAAPSADSAKRHTARVAERSRENHSAKAEIGELPPVKDPARREQCRLSLIDDLRLYYPQSTGLKPFSLAHEKVIARMQWSALEGAEIWNCVFRGFAKTSIAIGTVIWALKYGHRHFPILIAATKKFGMNILRMVKTQFETNPLLYEDFPEICHAVRALHGKTQGCASQTYRGQPTRMIWGAEEIALPVIAGSVASGSICAAFGITGALNGLVRPMPDGSNQRPDWYLGDDLQTRATARSATQIENRIDALQHSVMMLGGHEADIGGCINGTLFGADDVMQQLANPELFPSFSGEFVPMVATWAEAHESFWLTDYARVLKGFDATIPKDKERAFLAATALYLSRREEADAGCVVTWEHCYKHKSGEVSGIQHAYNLLLLQGDKVFATECQQELFAADGVADQLTLTDVTSKLSGLKRGQPPANTAKIVCYIDTQDESFWWAAVAWTADFTGYVIDCGVWPEQGRSEVSKAKLRKTLTSAYPQFKNPEPRQRAGLADLCDHVLGRDWLDADGGTHRISAALVDVKDGAVRKSIPSWIVGQKKWKTILRPAMGIGLKASDAPFGERKRDPKKERRRGLYWYENKDPQTPGGSIVFIDANSAKSFLANRWRVASPRPKDDPSYRPCEPGALYLWGLDPREHATFGAHHLAETVTRVTHEKSGRLIDFWQQKPNHPDNEWFDCLTGCCILADFAGGISLKDAGLATAPSRKRKRLSAAELRQLKEARAA